MSHQSQSTKPRLRGVIFDMDGTLGDTIPVCLAAYRAAVEEPLGRKFSDEDIYALFGPSEEGILQRTVPDIWEERMKIYMEVYEEVHRQCREPFPGIKEALDLLKAKDVKLAVVTGKGEHSCRISLHYLGLAEYFDAVVAGSANGAEKPDAIRRVLAKWDIRPDQAAYVGDALYDVDAAREAGVLPLAAAWAESADPEALAAKGPEAVFRTVQEFIEWACSLH